MQSVIFEGRPNGKWISQDIQKPGRVAVLLEWSGHEFIPKPKFQVNREVILQSS